MGRAIRVSISKPREGGGDRGGRGGGGYGGRGGGRGGGDGGGFDKSENMINLKYVINLI